MGGEEAAEVRVVEVAERRLPEVAVLAQLLGQVGEALRLLVELGERARAEDAEGVRDAVEEPDIRLPRRPVAPRLAQEGIDQRRALLARVLRRALEQALQVDLRGPDRHVGRAVGGQHVEVCLREGRARLERLEEMERVADVVLAAVLGVAAVGRAVGRGGEVAAHRAARLALARAHRHQVRERAGEALRHERDDAHAPVELAEKPGQLLHRDRLLLAPEDDPVVGGVLVVLGAVIGDVDEQRVAGAEPPARLFEPRGEPGPGRRLQRHAGDPGVGVDDLRAERRRQPGAAQEPEVGLGLDLAHRHVGLRGGAVGAEDRDVVGRHTGACEELEQTAEVEEVGLVVLRLAAAAVHHEHVEVGHGRHVGRDGACPAGDHEEGGGEEAGGPGRPAARRGSQRRSIHHGGVAPKRAVTSSRSLAASLRT